MRLLHHPPHLELILYCCCCLATVSLLAQMTQSTTLAIEKKFLTKSNNNNNNNNDDDDDDNNNNNNTNDIHNENNAISTDQVFKSRPHHHHHHKKQPLKQHRAKRTAYKTAFFYPFGIVPYDIAPDVSRRDRNIIRSVIDLYQNLTCIRFVPRHQSLDGQSLARALLTQQSLDGQQQQLVTSDPLAQQSTDGQQQQQFSARDIYNLGHDRYVTFIEVYNCFGGRRSRSNDDSGGGQGYTSVSCCERDNCIEEIGEALGLIREHQHPGSQGFLRINYDEIRMSERVRFTVASQDEIVPGHPFDMSSPMAYDYRYRPEVTVLTSDIRNSLNMRTFYMFNEISDYHQCPRNNCSDFTTNCLNDGYVTMIQGACACRCPEGLNPLTGCATVLSGDRTENRCGGVFELNSENPMVNFEKSFEHRDECSWLINAPVGDTIVLEFHQFHFPKRRGECADEIDIRYSRIGQYGHPFCGTESPVLIRSYFNRLMLTFYPIRRQVFRSVLNVTAKLVADSSLCYKTFDKGFTYRGTQSFTRQYTKCVPWSQALDCPHNPYKFSDMSAGLDANFCRNPGGKGLRPWCYVDANTCSREYCDVCHVDTPFDRGTPTFCASLLGDDGLCHSDQQEASRYHCFKSCWAQQRTPLRRSSSDVICPRPPPMLDSFQVDKRNRENFTLGETVTFRCRHRNRLARTELKKYCLSTGEWSDGQTACLPCHKEKGFFLYNDNCYKIQTESRTANQHQARCRAAVGGNLADVRNLEEQKYISKLGLQHGASVMYIGANDMFQEGQFRFRDYSMVTWAPWVFRHGNAPGNDCVMTNSMNKWYVTVCNARQKAVCKSRMIYHERLGESQCRDSRDNCVLLLANDHDLCRRDHGSFAVTQCPRTCSKCFDLDFNIF